MPHQRYGFADHLFVHRTAKEYARIAFIGKVIGDGGEPVRRPAFLGHGAADVEADELIIRPYALRRVEIIGRFIPCGAGNQLQAVVSVIVDAQLNQHVEIHIGGVKMEAVQPRIGIHERPKQKMTHADELLGLDGRR